MTDARQKVVQSYTYDSFGGFKKQGNKVKDKYAFTGRIWDSDIKLYDYRNRDYDFESGRFTTYDPSLHLRGSPEIPYLRDTFLKTPQKLNPYVYMNNPISFVDPYGLDINSVDFTVDYFVVGAGESIVWCCDKNKKKHRATYHKICYGFSIGANAASFGSPLTEEACPPKNGWKNEVCGALGGGLGTSWGGGNVSTGPVIGVGGGYMRCYYYLWNDKITGCCDNK